MGLNTVSSRNDTFDELHELLNSNTWKGATYLFPKLEEKENRLLIFVCLFRTLSCPNPMIPIKSYEKLFISIKQITFREKSYDLGANPMIRFFSYRTTIQAIHKGGNYNSRIILFLFVCFIYSFSFFNVSIVKRLMINNLLR